MGIQVYHCDEAEVRLPMIARDARLVVWPGVGAMTANMNYVVMAAGEANVPHSHPVSEDTIVVFAGAGTIEDLTHGVSHPFEAGQVVHVPVGLQHQVRADRGKTIESVGGPCPGDLAGLRSAGVLGDDPGQPPGV
ncbi:MAG: cupin domain-containing protein [Actinomycetota bacterium]|nr:cupin domain-containing protein [Actinomycetota bacterium]